jgi:putative flavoprotein involved in K+ transport
MITTTNGSWRARTVVVASGAYNLANIPAFADAVPAAVRSLPATEDRNPDQLDGGGGLVVGASATSVQLAQEIQRAGRPVTLAVGGNVRVPRVYRGMDIMGDSTP